MMGFALFFKPCNYGSTPIIGVWLYDLFQICDKYSPTMCLEQMNTKEHFTHNNMDKFHIDVHFE
jgi:hypothetical protein